MSKKQKKRLFLILLSACLLILAFVTDKLLSLQAPLRAALYLIPYLIIGIPIIKKAVISLFHLQPLDENFLMSIASIGAFALGEFAEAIFVLLFYQVGELFESIATGKSRRSIAALMRIRPDKVNVLVDGQITPLPAEKAKIGDVFVVGAGEQIALDGEIINGSSTLDTSVLTGEAMPRAVDIGDKVLSGCINLEGVIYIRAEKEFSQSTCSKILELVQNSTLSKAKTEGFITKFARIYTPIVVFVALAISLIPPLIWGDFASWIHRGLTMLVVSCPCALVLSVPLTYFASLGGLAKKGILVKGSNFLEALTKAKVLAMDKTGTLTTGRLKINEVWGDKKTLALAAICESFSTHPIALAIKNACKPENKPTDVTEFSGKGVIAYVDGKQTIVGNEKLMCQNGIIPQKDATVFVAQDGKLLGGILLTDELKPDAKQAITQLKTQGIKKITMLSGDLSKNAAIVAQALDISFYADLLPQDKTEKARQIRAEGGLIYVGDGINDSPTLALADVGIAMGALGSDAAIEAADVVIMDDRLSKIPFAIRSARFCKRIVFENIIFSLGVKLVVLVCSLFFDSIMAVAIFADVGVLILTLLNAMRALKL